jgi:branched-chain amino acid transport system ATP-binding protein
VLEISHLDIFHGNLQVIWDLELKVSEGEVVALLGPNGAGKTTLVEAIMGLNRQATGSIRFSGEEILGLHPYEIFRRGLALIPEKRELFTKMPVVENLLLGASGRPGSGDTLNQV